MRLLLVSGTFPDQICGVGDYTALLARALARIRDLEHIDVLTSTGPGPARPIEGVEVHRIMEGWRLDEIERLRDAILRCEPDVVHLMYPSRLGTQDRGGLANAIPWVARGVRRRGRVPAVVTTLHEFSERSRRFRARAWLNLVASDGIVFTSELDRDAALGWPGLARSQQRVIPIAANLSPASTAADVTSVRRRRGLSPESFLVVHFGLLAEDRGLEVLARASRWLASDGVELLVIGEPPPRVRRRAPRRDLEALRAAEQEGTLRRIGHLAAPELSALLAAADAAVFPFAGGASARRGSMLAAMAHGLPIVTTDGPCVPRAWSAADPPAILVSPGDAAALAAALMRLRDDRALRRRLGAAARKRASTPSWEEIASRTAELYAESAAAARR